MVNEGRVLPADGPLPPGYTAIGPYAFHVARLQQHTTDLHRFRRCFPIVAEMLAGGPSAVAKAITAATDEESAELLLTMEEAKAFFDFATAAVNGQIEEGRRRWPRPSKS